jgi:hypothetical protein
MKSRYLNLLAFAGGIILMIFNLGLWINGLLFNIESGFDSLFAIFLLVPAAFLLLVWYKNTRTIPPAKHRKWKFILNILLINYTILYFIYIISDLKYHASIDLMSIPGIILPILLGIYLTGFILSWKYELYTSIFFLLWYALVLFGSFNYGEIMARGPHMHFGIVIFVHGILYLVYYFRIKPKK